MIKGKKKATTDDHVVPELVGQSKASIKAWVKKQQAILDALKAKELEDEVEDEEDENEEEEA